MLNHKIRSRAIRENWSLDRILTETALDEQTAEQAGAINKKVDEETSHERVKKIASRKTKYQPNKDDACPAIGISCDNCGKKNHYARVCFGKVKQQTENRNQKQRQGGSRNRTESRNNRDRRDYRSDDKREISQARRTRHVGHQSSDDSSSDDECFMNHLKTHHTSKDSDNQWKTCTIQINGVNIEVEPDSGSDTNVMDESQFEKLRQQAPEVKIKDTKINSKP